MSDQDVFMLCETAYRSGLKIRPIRIAVGIDQLVQVLKQEGHLTPDGRRLDFGYGGRVYRVFPDKAPKKLGEAVVRELLANGGATQAQPVRTEAAPYGWRRGDPLSYQELLNLKDGSQVWVSYRNPDTNQVVIHSLHTIRRSHGESTTQVPAWKLQDVAEKEFFEVFRQDPERRTGGQPAVDEDGMSLFWPKPKTLPG